MQVTAATRPLAATAPAAATPARGLLWAQAGPTRLEVDKEQNYQGLGPIAGEVVDIAISPLGKTDEALYIATNNGGVWRSRDGGKTWCATMDALPGLSLGAVALDPANPQVVYAGTGNLFDGGREFSKAIGIYKSIDGGETWNNLGRPLLENRGVSRIVLPTSGVVMVGTVDGLYRSADGGLHFGSNAPSFDDGKPVLPGFITDILMDSATASIVYAAVNGSGVYRSTDGGATFPTNLLTAANGGPAGPMGMITCAQSVVPDNQVLFANVQSCGDTKYCGLFKSSNGGTSWTVLPDAAARALENNGAQLGYDQTIGVDPQNPDRVYLGFQELYLSIDGGTTFGSPAVSSGKVHWDHHALVFSPRSHWVSGPTPLYVGTDGGLSRSMDGGTTWSNLNDGVATVLFKGIDIGRGAGNDYTYGGTQDTGTVQHRPDDGDGVWRLGVDGDGERVVVDPKDPLWAYATTDDHLVQTTNGGRQWNYIQSADSKLPGCPNSPNACAWPLAADPTNNMIVYVAAGAQLFRSTDRASTFELVGTFGASIRSLKVAPSDTKVLWIGLADGSVVWTDQADKGSGSQWTPRPVTAGPGLPASDIAVDPSDAARAVVVFEGYSGAGSGLRTKHVFLTINSGASWSDISGTDGGNPNQNVPDLPVHGVVIDSTTGGQGIVIATAAGVLHTIDEGKTWRQLGAGLPVVDCTSLALDIGVSPPLLRAGTYGRSVFELTRPQEARLSILSNLAFGVAPPNGANPLGIRLINAGGADLTVKSVAPGGGTGAFRIDPAPALPATLPPGESLEIKVRFVPPRPGDTIGALQVASDDPTHPIILIPASGSMLGTLPSPSIAVTATDTRVTSMPDDASAGPGCKPVPRPSGWMILSLGFLLAAMGVAAWFLPPTSGSEDGGAGRPCAFLLSALLLALFGMIVGRAISGRWGGLFIDSRYRISLSRFQAALWTVIVLSAYGTAAISNLQRSTRAPRKDKVRRIISPLLLLDEKGTPDPNPKAEPIDPLGVQVPKELWIVMGIAVTSLVGTPLLLTTKQDKSPPQDAVTAMKTRLTGQSTATVTAASDDASTPAGCLDNSGLLMVRKCPECAEWRDLFRGEEVADAATMDLSKLQMFYLTMVLALSYVVAIMLSMAKPGPVGSLPPLSTSAVALLAISHTAYLTAKGLPSPKS